MSANDILGYTASALAGDGIRHSPDWYRRRTKNEILQPYYLRDWLHADMDYIGADNTVGGTDNEMIDIYEEQYKKDETIREHGVRLEELLWEEAKTDDRPMYQRYKKDIHDDEKHYDDTITKIAQNILSGDDKELKRFLKKVKADNQRDKPYNKTDKKKETLTNEGFGEGLELGIKPTELFAWKEKMGCDRDWQKEINHHATIQTILQSVREKIKQIAVEEMQVLDYVEKKHSDRLDEMTTKTTNNVDELWVNRETLQSIKSIVQYNEDGARLTDMVEKENDKRYGDRLDRIKKMILKNTAGSNPSKPSFDDFE